jgi:hypothetical protein
VAGEPTESVIRKAVEAAAAQLAAVPGEHVSVRDVYDAIDALMRQHGQGGL